MLSRNPDGAHERARRRGVAWDPRPARARRGAERPRRRRAPGRRERRPALDRGEQAPDPREPRASARATSSPACAPPTRGRRCSCPRSAVGYYGPRGDERVDESTPPGTTTSWPRSAWPGSARPTRRRSSGCASSGSAPASCSTQAAARSRRCCRPSSSASAARSPAATSTCRGSTSTTSSGSTSPRSTTSAGAARSTPPRPSRSRTRSSPRRSAARCTAPRSRRSPASRSRRSTARWRRSSPTASARSRPRATELGYAFAHPDLDEALRVGARGLAILALSAARARVVFAPLRAPRRHAVDPDPSEPGSSASALAALRLVPERARPSSRRSPRGRARRARSRRRSRSSSSPEARPGLLAVALALRQVAADDRRRQPHVEQLQRLRADECEDESCSQVRLLDLGVGAQRVRLVG